ncbi:MAG TPA: ferritin-like domain-containing protein [Thermoanaerobaculia bacterium]|nr:ferritin-like domain-containing protein [Thermoanaerobaculia bacterium]
MIQRLSGTRNRRLRGRRRWGAALRTREQLVAALQEAAEIEHQLMIQYLYAAFSLKKRPDERAARRSSRTSGGGARRCSWWRTRRWSLLGYMQGSLGIPFRPAGV